MFNLEYNCSICALISCKNSTSVFGGTCFYYLNSSSSSSSSIILTFFKLRDTNLLVDYNAYFLADADSVNGLSSRI